MNNKTKKSAYSSSSSKTTSEIEMKAIGEVAAAEKEEKKKAEVNSVYTHSANTTSCVTVSDNIKKDNMSMTATTDALFDRKFENVINGLQPFLANTLKDISMENLKTIINYMLALRTEINPSDNYRRTNIEALCKLSKLHRDEQSKEHPDYNNEDRKLEEEEEKGEIMTETIQTKFYKPYRTA